LTLATSQPPTYGTPICWQLVPSLVLAQDAVTLKASRGFITSISRWQIPSTIDYRPDGGLGFPFSIHVWRICRTARAHSYLTVKRRALAAVSCRLPIISSNPLLYFTRLGVVLQSLPTSSSTFLPFVRLFSLLIGYTVASSNTVLTACQPHIAASRDLASQIYLYDYHFKAHG
jgi:hypothetical protein